MRQLSDEDISAIVEAMHKGSMHPCRFPEVDPEVLGEAIVFYRKFNAMIDESGKIIWKTVLVSSIGGLILLLGLGAIAKVREISGQ